MKQVITFLLSGFLALTSCKGQENKLREQGQTDSTRIGNKIIEQDKSEEPRINSKVNREYDENGKLRRFDSTYTYSYNYGGGNLPDSLPGIIEKHFNGRFFSGDSTLSGDDFLNDSFLKDFFAHDRSFGDPFFSDHFKNDTTVKHVPRIIGPDENIFNSDRFRQMLRNLDSLNMEFFKRHDLDPEKFFHKGDPGAAK